MLSLVNGIYLCAHNVFRGFPKEASIGNLFRSILAIPVSSLYNWILYQFAFFMGVDNPAMYLVPSAAVISKMASDSVAALIEGYADSQVNLRMRRWDYRSVITSYSIHYTKLYEGAWQSGEDDPLPPGAIVPGRSVQQSQPDSVV